MKKNIYIPLILFVFVVIISFFALGSKKSNVNQGQIDSRVDKKNENEIILFYGDGCPHCIIVDEYIEENEIKDKIDFSHKEVYYNQQNAEELGQKARTCGLSTNSISVPLLFTGEQCLIGDREIINFFEQKTN